MSEAPSPSPSPPPPAAGDGAAEPRADDFLAPVMFGLIAAVREGAGRVSVAHDAEAVHDLRVAVRRLRTVLRPARRVYGKHRMRAIGEELRRFAQATGALRDEEVLREILTELDLPARTRKALDAWLVQRARQERARRRRAVALVRAARQGPGAPPLREVLARLERRLGRRRPGVPSAHALAEETLAAAAAGVAELLHGHAHDAAAMHALRIRYKRLRYSAEIFAALLGDRAAPIGAGAARMQKRLGELHDLEQALVRIARARTLPAATRAAVERALARARRRQRERVHRNLVEERRRSASETPPPASREP